MKPGGWFVYMLACERDCVYTGVAVDVVARYARHCAGAGAAFTRANRPRGILGSQRCATRSAALRLEYALKQLPRPAKLAWAARHPFGPRRIRGSRTVERGPGGAS